MVTPWLPELPEHLRVGTSSFSWSDWNGVFYPAGLKPADRLGWYARWFTTVEVDATFYSMPSARMLSSWALKTPETFSLALKVPQAITHEAQLAGADAAVAEFLARTSLLGPRRGPLLLQFPYLAKGDDEEEYERGDRFYQRLLGFLDRWAGAADWVVEIRNPGWLRPRLLTALRERQVPLALTASRTMPSLPRLVDSGLDPLTGPFAYVRFLGDRRAIDRRIDEEMAAGRRTARFESLLYDREGELRHWVDALLPIVARMRTWVYFNNHYAGFGPGSAQLFARLWREIHDW